MNQQDGELCVRVLCSVAWADGDLSEDEISSVIDIVDRLDYADRSLIQEILATPLQFKFLEKVKALEPKARVRLIHDCYVLADYCSGVGDPEREIIRTIAETLIDAKDWERAEESLRAWVEYETKARKVWGWTHLAG
jgi:uncharacterized tellurite resistance protein B-like protein